MVQIDGVRPRSPGDQKRNLHLLSRADDGFAQRLALVRRGQWAAQTPCTEWDVRALVNHVVSANCRYTMLLHGATTDEVEATRAVDHLGDDPVASFAATAAELKAAFGEPGAMARTACHWAGARTGAQLLEMRVLDIAGHTWDLARAIGAGESLDPRVVAFALTLQDTLDAGRQRGAFAPPPGKTRAGSSAQARLLHLAGRRPG
ncbi:MAG TPA: TIGR03086 family metal-binding protein [Streptosporangiaceae bacterium]|nr:TIGR03086 family metal-binding protein [Streptosporangiaceae bacterium]